MKTLIKYSSIILLLIVSCKKNDQEASMPFKIKNNYPKIIIKLKNEKILSDEFLKNNFTEKQESYFKLMKTASEFDNLQYKTINKDLSDLLINFAYKSKKKYQPLFPYPVVSQYYDVASKIKLIEQYAKSCVFFQNRLPNYITIPIDGIDEEEANSLIQIISSSNYSDAIDYAFLHTALSETDITSTTPINPTYVLNTGDSYRTQNQNYLDSLKIDKLWWYAQPNKWNSPNKIGANVGLIDVEAGWFTSTSEYEIEELNNLRGANSHASKDVTHGTMVLGIIKSSVPLINLPFPYFNSNGISGIAPSADTRLVSVYNENFELNEFRAVLIAIIEAMKFEDKPSIILLERYINNTQPLESSKPIFDLIRIATKCLNITVVEAAANGNLNFDSMLPCTDSYCFYSRKSHDFSDSGAILVGCTEFLNTERGYGKVLIGAESGNIGSRIDVFLWGRNIYTTYTSFEETEYSLFSHTSGAAAITAGIATSLQWYAQTKYNRIIPALKMREFLTNNPQAINPSCTMNYDTYVFQMPNYQCLMSKVDNFFDSNIPVNCTALPPCQ